MKEKIYRQLVELSNGKVSSSLLRKFTTGKLSKSLIPSYIKFYEIETKEVSSNIKDFKSLHQFFIRTLKKEARPIDERENMFVSPVDAKIESFGEISSTSTFVVKGKSYTLTDLLGNVQMAEKYKDGYYIVFYLSPADYHRMHSPANGKVVKQYVLGQKSYPVNQIGLKFGKNPLSQNYRMISELTYGNHYFSFIKVGAMFVNSIELTNKTSLWTKGEEVGYFTFGSTVILLFEKDTIVFCPNVEAGASIRVGEAFATMV